MDTLTHALSGALIARATHPRKITEQTLPVGRRMLVGAAAAAFPDLDFVTSYITPLAYLYHHRGVTHSLLMLPLWTVLVAVILAAIWKFRPWWRAYLGVAAIGIATHIAGDLITSFGTMIFAPVSDARYALSATFIIDLCFTGIILIGLLAAWGWRRSRAASLAASLALVGYVGFQWLMQQQAIAFGRDYASRAGINALRVTAMPRPVSPFNWTVFVEEGEQYRYAHINLVRKSVLPQPDEDTGFIARLNAPYRPLREAQWIVSSLHGNTPDERSLAREAYGQADFRFFRWFAAYPSLFKIEVGNPSACVWFHDLRFLTPGRAVTPFRYGMCRENGGEWQPFQWIGEERRPVF